MISQENIVPATPFGANLVSGGATFKVWAPTASAVYINGEMAGLSTWTQTPATLMAENGGFWTGFVAGALDGDAYKFYVVGEGSSGYKRDPYARELTLAPAYPNCNCIIRDPKAFVWHDSGFKQPAYSEMVIYQLHVGTYAPGQPGAYSTFLDVIERLEYIAALGVNVLQPLPIDEAENSPSLGYNGADYYSPDFPYVVYENTKLAAHLVTINRLLANKGFSPIRLSDITSAPNQLKILVDLCHVYGIAVTFDVVYNHAGGFDGDDGSLYFWDRQVTTSNNNSLFFTDQGWAGGLSFALWNQNVAEFLNAANEFYVEECHVDGFRYDEVSVLVSLNGTSGWGFCQGLTTNTRGLDPGLIQNAEFWPVTPAIVGGVGQGGAGFDVLQHDGLRNSIRTAISQASYGAAASIDLGNIAAGMYPQGFSHGWQAVTCIENHDIVKIGTQLRLPALADASNHRSWYARSRSRLAATLLFAAPGIPMIFMGQEFLEDKQWSDDPTSANLIYWGGVDAGDKPMVDFLRFFQDLVHVRLRQPALRSDSVNVYYVCDQDRVIALHRWVEGIGRDIIVVASLREQTYYGYDLGFPQAGTWSEVFNSDVYDNWVNPVVAGNGGAITVDGQPLHGFAHSCRVVIPANGVVMFAL